MFNQVFIIVDDKVRFHTAGRFLTVLSFPNSTEWAYQVCAAYLKQHCDNRVKQLRANPYLNQDGPLGDNSGRHEPPGFPEPPVAMKGIFISPNNNVPQTDLNTPHPQRYFHRKSKWLT